MKLSRLTNRQLRNLLRKGEVRFAERRENWTPKFGYILQKAIRDFVITSADKVAKNPKLLEVEKLLKELEERDPVKAKAVRDYIKFVKSGLHYDLWDTFYKFVDVGDYNKFKWLD